MTCCLQSSVPLCGGDATSGVDVMEMVEEEEEDVEEEEEGGEDRGEAQPAISKYAPPTKRSKNHSVREMVRTSGIRFRKAWGRRGGAI